MKTRGTTPRAVLAMLAGMRALGLDTDAICAEAGLSPARLADPDGALDPAEFIPIWRVAAARFGRGTIGLHVGSHVPFGAQEVMDYVAATSATLGAALSQVERYFGLLTRQAGWRLRADGNHTLFESYSLLPAGMMPQALIEYGIGVALSRVRECAGVRPLEVRIGHAPLGPVEDYQKLLGPCVRFECESSALVFDAALLATPCHRHDPGLFQLLEAHAALLLEKLPSEASLRDRVQRIVSRLLKDGSPEITAVARELGTSDRSLQRKLQDEGTSYKDVVDGVRREFALLYLGDNRLSITEVAYLLGYSEAAAFNRAFKRWTGHTPSDVRAAH